MFNFVLGNTDRHGYNWMIKKEIEAGHPPASDFFTPPTKYRMVLIDNGLNLPRPTPGSGHTRIDYLNSTNPHFQGRFNQAISKDTKEVWASEERWSEAVKMMKNAGIEDEAIEGAALRRKKLLESDTLTWSELHDYQTPVK